MTDLTITSSAFDAGEPIPEKYGKAYENLNPPLTVGGVPDEAESLTLIVDDPDAPGGTFLHWLVWNIPPDITDIPAGWEPPSGVVQGENDFGEVGYGGPKPPSEHTYRFKLFAVDTMLELSSGAGVQAVTDAMDGHLVGQDELTGTFAP
ncbi:MAG: YbhB/YbcL family Raf kinase inhibitor-like protein [Halanaeroarchaeum sp.]